MEIVSDKAIMTKLIVYLSILLIAAGSTSAVTLNGKVYDAVTKQPIPFSTIIVTDRAQSIMSNEEGYFRLKLLKGKYSVKFSHVAYYSVVEDIDMDSTDIEVSIYLNPAFIELPTINVYDRNYDAAQRIILQAIKRKDEILSQLNKYNFEAYTKVVVRDTSKSDSTNILLITETQLKAFWEYPDRYKEIITARKQSANLDASGNLVAIGKILNFNSNRIDFGEQSIVSPTAKDALDYYNYYLLDTLYYDSSLIYLLEIEPKSKTTPLFQGTIRIADSSFAVVGVDITFNEGFDNLIIKSLKLEQEFQEFHQKYWMPTVIKYFAIIDIPIPLIPTLSFDYTAALHQFHFEPDRQDTVFNDYVLEVDEHADDYDSTRWYDNQLIPLTDIEIVGYNYIDSVENNKPLYKKLLPLIPASIYLVGFAQDYFHFNRVEGPYLGGKFSVDGIKDKFAVHLKTGYSFDAEIWQHRYNFTYLFNDKRKLKFGFEYQDEIKTQNTVISKPNGNSTLKSMFEKTDPYNYHLEKGFNLTTSIRPFSKVNIFLSYNDYNQYSIFNNSDYSFFNRKSSYRENPTISEGKLRSFSFKVQYDSRHLMKIKGKERIITSYPFTILKIGGEKADPSFIDNDFNFTQLYTSLYTERRVLGLGIGKLSMYGGKTVSGVLPPQKYFTIDYGADIMGYSMTFKTLDKLLFSGNRVFSLYYNHDFGTMLFKKSRLPFIQNIPYSFNLHGGVFWTDLNNHIYQIGDEYIKQTDKPYSEVGFGIGRLPLLLKVYFTWQLSAYDTNKFYWGLDIGF